MECIQMELFEYCCAIICLLLLLSIFPCGDLESCLWLLNSGLSSDLLGALAGDLGSDLRVTHVVESSGSPGDHFLKNMNKKEILEKSD